MQARLISIFQVVRGNLNSNSGRSYKSKVSFYISIINPDVQKYRYHVGLFLAVLCCVSSYSFTHTEIAVFSYKRSSNPTAQLMKFTNTHPTPSASMTSHLLYILVLTQYNLCTNMIKSDCNINIYEMEAQEPKTSVVQEQQQQQQSIIRRTGSVDFLCVKLNLTSLRLCSLISLK